MKKHIIDPYKEDIREYKDHRVIISSYSKCENKKIIAVIHYISKSIIFEVHDHNKIVGTEDCLMV